MAGYSPPVISIQEGPRHCDVFFPLSDKITADVGTVKGTFPSTRGEFRREKRASVCVRENDSVLWISWPRTSFRNHLGSRQTIPPFLPLLPGGWGVLCDVCCMVNVVVWGQWIYKRACCQNQFCISPGGSMHYHNTSSADWGCEFIITTKKRAGWGFSMVDIQMFHWNRWGMTIQSKVTVFSSLHVQYTMGFVLFLDPQMFFWQQINKTLSTIDRDAVSHSILK